MGSPGFVIYTLREILIPFFLDRSWAVISIKKIEPKKKERFVIRRLPADEKETQNVSLILWDSFSDCICFSTVYDILNWFIVILMKCEKCGERAATAGDLKKDVKWNGLHTL